MFVHVPVCTFVCAFTDARVIQTCGRSEDTQWSVLNVHMETFSMHTHLAARTHHTQTHINMHTSQHTPHTDSRQHTQTPSTHTHTHSHHHQRTQDTCINQKMPTHNFPNFYQIQNNCFPENFAQQLSIFISSGNFVGDHFELSWLAIYHKVTKLMTSKLPWGPK